MAKAWVMLSDKMPHWPCVVYIRTPFSASGADFLRTEKRVFIVPTGKKAYPLIPYYPGVWFATKHISPFRGPYQDERIRAGIGHSNSKLAENFKVAIDTIMSPQFRLHKEPVVDHPFRWEGALDTSGKHSSASAVAVAGAGAGAAAVAVAVAGAGGARKRKQDDKSDDVDALSSSGGGRTTRTKEDVLAAPIRHCEEARRTVGVCNMFDARLCVPKDVEGNSSLKQREARNALPNLLSYVGICESEPFALARLTSVAHPFPPPRPKMSRPSMRRQKPRTTKLAALSQSTAPVQAQAQAQAARKRGRPKGKASTST
jgi:hypothetical protein